MHDEIVVVLAQAVVEIDHAADELRREDADAAVVEQVDAGRLPLLARTPCSCRDADRRG